MHKPYVEHLHAQGKFDVWLVDGKWIRDNMDIDFTEGGNSERYDYVPENEIWIDNSNRTEKRAIIAHEVYEDQKMHEGLSYSKAHDLANKVEAKVRGNNLNGKNHRQYSKRK